MTANVPYRARLRRVLAYIDAHLSEDLSVETLSDIARFSKFHFHRQFSTMMGVPVQRYVQLTRMKRAAHELAYRDDSVMTVALDSGHEGPEAFARAFKQRVGQAPTDFRKSPQWELWQSTYKPVKEAKMAHRSEVRIVDTEDKRVAALEHRGDPSAVSTSIRRFIAWRRANGLSPNVSDTFNVLYDDPETTPPESYRLDLCCTTPSELEGDGMIMKTIPGGRCATVRHTGSDDAYAETLMYLYANWLPESGEEPRDFPLYCQRLTFFPDVGEHEAVTDFFLPLK